MVNFKLKWHAQYAVYPLASEHALLLSELDSFMLSERKFSAINVVVEKQGKLADYLFQQDDKRSQIEKLEQIDTFVADKILVNPQHKGEQQFITPDFSLAISNRVVDCRTIYNLSSTTASDVLQCIAKSVGLADEVSLVFVDDYLDPRLPTLSQQLNRQAVSWLLIKPYGQKTMVGPLFNHQDENRACYQCLRDRLAQNSPVRVWLTRSQDPSEIAPFPLLVDDKCIEHTLDILSNVQFDDDKSQMYSHRWDEQQPDCHSIDKRPQCAACGDHNYFVKDNHGPIELDDCIRTADADGGYRAVSRNSFLENTRHLIDAQTGIITELEEITGNSQAQGMSIYRAAYFQNTFTKDNLTADTFVQQSLGKGISTEQSMSSALGEALERQAAQYVGDEGCVCATITQLNHAAYIPQELSSFSEKQYDEFSNLESPSLQCPQWVEKHLIDQPMHWATGWSLTCQKTVYFPAAFCFANTPFEDRKYSSYTHNGNSCGSTKEEAILQGLMELIERDAVAVWWYNQIPRPQLSLDIIPDVERKKIDETLSAQWRYWLLDVTNNINVVTCVAVGQYIGTDRFVLGFGTHINPSVAAQRALTEMYQLVAIKDRVSGPFDFDSMANRPFMFPKRKTQPKTVDDYDFVYSANIKDGIDYVVEQVEQVGLDVCVVNYTRADIPVSTVKVIVPGLAHFWPQFANKRLYQVPVELGWLSHCLEEEYFNGQALYL
jgi:bacteriocin biosynthesis cyclodehydratase domain-containing protein